MKGEIWKPVKGYEGLYQVSNMGRVKSLNYRHTGKERILKARKNRGGYLQVNLYKEGKMKRCSVHQLVGQVFCENPMGYTEVNHVDEDKTNNMAENLEFCSRSYNCSYGTRSMRVAEKNTNNPKISKPVIAIDVRTGLILEFVSSREAERETGISNSSIIKCCKGKRNSAGGFYWMYRNNNDTE